jgi:hypothetical protein
MAESLKSGEILDFVEGLAGQAIPQPPLGYLPLILGSLWSPEHARLLGSLCWLLLIGDAWRRIVGNTWMLVALLMSPMIWQYSWENGWDLAAGAVVLQGISWLERSEGFSRRGPSLAVGAWVGLGILCKYTVPFFWILPGLFTLFRIQQKNIRNLLYAAGIAGFLLLPWGLLHGSELAPYMGGSLSEDVGKITLNGRSWGERLSFSGLSYYPLALKDAVGWPGLLLMGLGWGLEFRHTFRFHLPFLAAVGGIGVLSLLPAAVDRYALPALILGMGGIWGLRWMPAGGLLATATFGMLGIGSFQSFREPVLTPPTYQHLPSPLSWPQSRSYRRFQVDTSRLDAYLRDHLPAERGQVGLFLPFDGRLPDVGVLQERAWNLGWRGELVPRRPVGGKLPDTPFPQDLSRVLAWVGSENDRSWLKNQGFMLESTGETWKFPDAQWQMESWKR